MTQDKNFIVYNSSAGSGKTYTIVREYIRLALHNSEYFRRILAITFTNKAANEMKSRVLNTLLHLSEPARYSEKPAVKDLLPELELLTGLRAEEITARAENILTAILHGYDDFSVRTIDSFVTRIIRTFAHDLKLPQDFEIEMDKDILIKEAIERLLEKIGVDEELTAILLGFTLAKTEDEKSWNITNDLSVTAAHLFEEAAIPFLGKLDGIKPSAFLSTAGKIRRYDADLKKRLADPASAAIRLAEASDIPLNAFYQGNNGIGSYLEKISRGIINEPNSYIRESVETGKWFSKGAENTYKAAFAEIEKEFMEKCLEVIQLLKEELATSRLFAMVERNIYQLGLLHAIQLELNAIRQENKTLHISEFNRRITEIINSEPVPFIYERTGEKHSHYMVDEFQDTSKLQWKNLLPLISNALANGNLNIVVGDGKQAIYRFRNGQVQQFISLPFLPQDFDRSIFGDAEKALERNCKKELLDINYRSLSHIIEFNNNLYEFLSGKLDPSISKVYQKPGQKSRPGKTGGEICIRFHENGDTTSTDAWNLSEVISLVQQLVGEMGYSYNDIAILTNTNNNGNKLASGLAEKGISVISAEALLIISSPAINLLVSAIRVLNNPFDMVSRASLVKHVMAVDSTWQALKFPDSLPDVSCEEFFNRFQQAGCHFDPEFLKTLPVYDLCEELIRLFRIGRDSYDVYIQFFLEFALKVTARGNLNLSEFLDSWDEQCKKLSVIVPEGIDAVRVMTIHKAKGLEFPVVIWPYATDMLKNSRRNLWVETSHKVLEDIPVALLQVSEELTRSGYEPEFREERNLSLLDLMNLMYVVTTRPVEKLYILTAGPKDAQKAKPGNTEKKGISVPELLDEFLLAKPEGWIKEGSQCTYGERNAGKRGEKDSMMKNQIFEGQFISNAWQNRIQIAQAAPHAWDVKEPYSRQNRGNLVHKLLSEIRKPSDCRTLLDRMVKHELIDEPERESLEDLVRKVVDHESLVEFFHPDNDIRSEAAILMPNGQLYRPDRVLFTGDGARVLDFKTGKPEDSHIAQVKRYAGILMEMGYYHVSSFLVYLDDAVTVLEV